MGFLDAGRPLAWDSSQQYINRVKIDGLLQLLHLWRVNKNRIDGDYSLGKWGDEVEFTLVYIDGDKQQAKICVDGPQILEQLYARELRNEWDPTLKDSLRLLSGSKKSFLRGSVWHPEYGRHMVESTPNPPYELSVDSFLEVEESMLSRRLKLQSILPPQVYATSLAAFPHFGVGDYVYSAFDDKTPEKQILSAGSKFVTEDVVNPHPRFPTLTQNVNARRRTRIAATIPVYKDHYTEDKLWQSSFEASQLERLKTVDRKSIEQKADETINPIKDQIYMDHFGFGMGMCCLQMTYGCSDLSSARYLYDQLSVLAPIFLSLSASTPALRGLLADTDTRWKVLEQTCDCRTDEEVQRMSRSRYGAVGTYISDCEYLARHMDYLNDDNTLPQDPMALKILRESGQMDDLMCRHFASLWVRDPLVIFEDKIDLDNTKFVDHFENIQSTNWNSVRFKVPPTSGGFELPSIGWRVELRTPDLQLSDFENAALACLGTVITLGILKDKWNFYIPITKSHENMETAHVRDSVTQGLFWFNVSNACDDASPATTDVSSSIQKLTLKEIFLGCRGKKLFEGLLPMCDRLVSEEWRHKRCSRKAVEKYRLYTNFIRARVLGQAWTGAKILRQTVYQHPEYERDSVVSSQVNYEIARRAILAGFGLCPENASWGIPGCLPSSARVCSSIDLNQVLELPVAQELLKVLNLPPFQLGTTELLVDFDNSSSDESDEDAATAAGAIITPSIMYTPVAAADGNDGSAITPSSDNVITNSTSAKTPSGFDAALFLQLEELSG